MAKSSFELDLTKIRQRARASMNEGAVTSAMTGDVARVIAVLNQALATEIVCVLRYKNHYYVAEGTKGQVVKAEFLEHANEEQAHADMLAERIQQLGGMPDMNPKNLATRAHTEYHEGDTLKHMVAEDLIAERIAIETYTEIIRWVGESDPTTRRMLETILAQEEEHADDLAELMTDL